MIPSLWIADAPLVLASNSATRRALLESAGLACHQQVSEVDERAIEQDGVDLAPFELSLRLACAKALAVSRRRTDAIVIGADQVLSVGDRLLHKPADRDGAIEQLSTLSGRAHVLHSAVALARSGVFVDSFVASATLTMRNLDSAAILAYVNAVGLERATMSVGAYQVEGVGIHLFDRIEGDHSTILGLPLIPLLTRLRDRGWLLF